MTEIVEDRIEDVGAKRSLVIRGRKTSITLEEAFWTSARKIAAEKEITISALVDQIDQARGKNNLSSQVRLYVLAYYKALAENA